VAARGNDDPPRPERWIGYRVWAERLEANGDAEAVRSLNALSQRLTADQIKEARARANPPASQSQTAQPPIH